MRIIGGGWGAYIQGHWHENLSYVLIPLLFLPPSVSALLLSKEGPISPKLVVSSLAVNICPSCRALQLAKAAADRHVCNQSGRERQGSEEGEKRS